MTMRIPVTISHYVRPGEASADGIGYLEQLCAATMEAQP
jgi:hypothetical protein